MSLEEDGAGPFSLPTITITVEGVNSQLRRLHNNRAPGHAGIIPRVLKVWADQLCGVLHHMYSLSLSVSEIPGIWKTYCIVPLPKTTNAKALKDLLRWSHMWWQVYRGLCWGILGSVPFRSHFNLLKGGVGTDDALLYLLHRVHSYLEPTAASVRILFLDLSSAFNTLQQHVQCLCGATYSFVSIVYVVLFPVLMCLLSCWCILLCVVAW